MDLTQVLTLLTNAPLTMVLLYLLISEQRAHAETRKLRDEEQHQWVERYASQTDRVVAAIDKLTAMH